MSKYIYLVLLFPILLLADDALILECKDCGKIDIGIAEGISKTPATAFKIDKSENIKISKVKINTTGEAKEYKININELAINLFIGLIVTVLGGLLLSYIVKKTSNSASKE